MIPKFKNIEEGFFITLIEDTIAFVLAYNDSDIKIFYISIDIMHVLCSYIPSFRLKIVKYSGSFNAYLEFKISIKFIHVFYRKFFCADFCFFFEGDILCLLTNSI